MRSNCGQSDWMPTWQGMASKGQLTLFCHNAIEGFSEAPQGQETFKSSNICLAKTMSIKKHVARGFPDGSRGQTPLMAPFLACASLPTSIRLDRELQIWVSKGYATLCAQPPAGAI